jgi:hypothetical protein
MRRTRHAPTWTWQDVSAERIALQVIGWSFLVLAAFVLYDSGKTLSLRERPKHSVAGIAILTLSVVIMPLLPGRSGALRSALALERSRRMQGRPHSVRTCR